MLQLCPFCGHFLSKPLCDGIATCTNCSRIFDSNPMNRLLSAGWLARRKRYEEVDDLVRDGFTVEEAKLVILFVVEQAMSPEEFFHHLREMGISDAYQVLVA